jgi:hypothetical protein
MTRVSKNRTEKTLFLVRSFLSQASRKIQVGKRINAETIGCGIWTRGVDKWDRLYYPYNVVLRNPMSG